MSNLAQGSLPLPKCKVKVKSFSFSSYCRNPKQIDKYVDILIEFSYDNAIKSSKSMYKLFLVHDRLYDLYPGLFTFRFSFYQILYNIRLTHYNSYL